MAILFFKTSQYKDLLKTKFRARVCATRSSGYDLFARVGSDLGEIRMFASSKITLLFTRASLFPLLMKQRLLSLF